MALPRIFTQSGTFFIHKLKNMQICTMVRLDLSKKVYLRTLCLNLHFSLFLLVPFVIFLWHLFLPIFLKIVLPQPLGQPKDDGNAPASIKKFINPIPSSISFKFWKLQELIFKYFPCYLFEISNYNKIKYWFYMV